MRSIAIAIVLDICFFALPLMAQEAMPLVIGETFSVYSETLGEDRPVIVALPAGYEAGSTRFPVIYLLDGPAHVHHTFGSLRHLAQQGRALPAVIVAVDNADRLRDLTPTTDAPGEQSTFPSSGGAEKFRAFLVNELRPSIDERYRTNDGAFLIGHSFGGLFAIDTAMRSPESFNGYIAISPSLWWSDERYVKAADNVSAQHPLFSRSLYVAMGAEGARMNEPFERFIEAIERNAPSEFTFGVGRFPDEDHGSVPLRATIAGFKTLFAPARDTVNMDQITDVAELERQFQNASRRIGFQVVPPELTVNQLGYRLLQSGRADEAREIFEWNVQTYPHSANVYDSLGECLENLGEHEPALENYQRAATIGEEVGDPNLEIYRANAVRMEKAVRSGG